MKLLNFQKTLPVICLCFITSCTYFQTGGQNKNPIIVGEVAGETITYDELITNFNKSINPSNQPEANDEELIEFLDLYLDFKAKLAVARDAEYYDDKELKAELEEYEKQSVYAYWLEKRVRDELLEELVERLKVQLNASHILISLPPKAAPQDTQMAYNILLEARERFYSGETFDKLSEEISTRRGGRSMGGDLGYFSGGWTVKSFEDVAYSMSVDSVSNPFRTDFGYHIVYLKDRIPTPAERKVSHIFLNTRNGNYNETSAMTAANEIYNDLMQGAEWSDLVEEHTQDIASRERDGDIGWIAAESYNQDFTKAIMDMDEVGIYYEPFYSGYGAHIVRLDSIRNEVDSETKRAETLEKLKQLPRYRERNEAVLEAIRIAGNEIIHKETLKAFEEHEEIHKESNFHQIKWPDELRVKVLYTINNHDFTVSDYINWLNDHVQNHYQHHHLDEFIQECTDKQVIPLTKKVFPEFNDLSDDYIHGLTVFKVNEDSIWNYAQRDTASLMTIYEANQNELLYEERYQYVLISADSDSILNKAVAAIHSGILPDNLRNEISNLSVHRDVTNNLPEAPFDLAKLNIDEHSNYFEYRNRRAVLLMEEIINPRPMTFDEAYSRLVAKYQPIREQNWLEQIRQKYSVKPYYNKLNTVQE